MSHEITTVHVDSHQRSILMTIRAPVQHVPLVDASDFLLDAVLVEQRFRIAVQRCGWHGGITIFGLLHAW